MPSAEELTLEEPEIVKQGGKFGVRLKASAPSIQYVVTIEQSDGLTAIYKSLSADTLVEEGDAVTTGTPIGYVSDSMTSEQNDGAHLHLEMKDADGGYVDPMTKLPDGTEK